MGAAGRKAVSEACLQIKALGTIHRQQFDPRIALTWQHSQVQLATAGMFEQIARQFGDHQCHASGIAFTETVLFGKPLSRAPCIADLAAVFDQ